MNTTKTLDRIKKQKEKKEFKQRFMKYKNYALKKFPEARLEMNLEGKFYVVDERGARILRDEYYMPEAETPFQAWKNTHDILWSKNIVDRNNRKFSDERIITGDFPGRKKSKIILK